MGMCGGFAVLANSGARRVGLNARFAAYVFGKTASYMVMGVGIGLVGSQIGAVKNGASVLAWMAGLALIGVGGHVLGWPGFARLGAPAASQGFISRFASLIKKDSMLARLGMGILNGWLPCGLVYAALAMGLSSGSTLEAGTFMAFFGLGTIPSLWIAAQLSAVLPAVWRSRLSRVSGWMVVLLGLFTILRGTGFLEAFMGAGHTMG